MITAEVLGKLRSFRLPGFIQALVEQNERPKAYDGLSFDERLSLLVESEHVRREASSLTRRLKQASLLSNATIDQVDFAVSRGLVRVSFLELAQGSWVQSNHHLIITGPTGVGKTFLGSALANNVCQRGYSVRYQRAHEWLAELGFAKADGSMSKVRQKLARTHLLLIDEWLREPLSASNARMVLDLLDDRFRRGSCMFISQVPVKDWHAQIQDPTLADAILDRVVSPAI